MSIVKSLVGWLGAAIFILSIMGVISTNAFSQFTKYENIKPVFLDILQLQLEKQIEQVGEEDMPLPPEVEYLEVNESEEIYQLLLDTCEGKDTVEIPMGVASELGYGNLSKIVIDCNDFRNSVHESGTAIEYLTTIVAGRIFDDFYYMEYDCSFLECIQRGDFFVLLSAKGNEFLNNIKILMFVGIGVGAAMVFMSYDKWYDRLRGFGWPMALTGLSYFMVGVVKNLIIDNLPPMIGVEQMGTELASIVEMVIKPMMNGLLLVMVIGIGLVAGGYILEYYEERKGREPKVVIK